MSHQSDLISSDIDTYLVQHEHKELLRFLTCGNVDDGKSTLIGRLLYDAKMIYEDQLAAVKTDSIKSGTTGDQPDLALLVDGLQAEREQGITIDVAYRYFSTSTRKFIIADTPGHEQYTRNMATGASTCDLAVILIDARYGIQTQTKRHSYIATLLGIKHIIVAINKMDLIDYSEAIFSQIKQDYLEFSTKLNLQDIQFIPISALVGDNVVNLSKNMSWYRGKPMMEVLNSVEIARDHGLSLRFSVQYVNRPNLNFRGFCGTISAGILHKDEKIIVLPSGKTSKIKSIITYDGELDSAYSPMAVTLTLEDEIDISRGDIIAQCNNMPTIADKFKATIVWMDEAAMMPSKQYIIKLGARSIFASIATIHCRTNINTLEHHVADTLQLNEIGDCTVILHASVVFDTYGQNKSTGAFIIIDRLTNITVGAGMITGNAETNADMLPVSTAEKVARFSQHASIINIIGDDCVSFAYQLERNLFDNGYVATVLANKNNTFVLANAIKQAGLVCLCANNQPMIEADIQIISNIESIKNVVNSLKNQGIII